jgi:hypothetical protein
MFVSKAPRQGYATREPVDHAAMITDQSIGRRRAVIGLMGLASFDTPLRGCSG